MRRACARIITCCFMNMGCLLASLSYFQIYTWFTCTHVVPVSSVNHAPDMTSHDFTRLVKIGTFKLVLEQWLTVVCQFQWQFWQFSRHVLDAFYSNFASFGNLETPLQSHSAPQCYHHQHDCFQSKTITADCFMYEILNQRRATCMRPDESCFFSSMCVYVPGPNKAII